MVSVGPSDSCFDSEYFFKEPEICGEKYFQLNHLCQADDLASDAKFLLQTLKQNPKWNHCEAYQIELRKISHQNQDDSTYRMHLRIDSVFWFENHSFKSKNIEELYRFGQAYVENIEKEIKLEFQGINEEKILRIPTSSSSVTTWCKTEREGYICQKFKVGQCQSYDHHTWCDDENRGSTGFCHSTGISPSHNKKYHVNMIDEYEKPVFYQCQHIITKLNREQVYCHFRVNPNFRIYHGQISAPCSYPYFLVSARHDATSVITLNPVKHCVNEEYIQTSDAWQAVLKTLTHLQKQWKVDRFPLDRIYVNFGKWMQQKADDPTRRFLSCTCQYCFNSRVN